MKVIVLDKKERQTWERSITALELGVSYPLGDDRFELDHGKNYFAFFERLGEVVSVIGTEEEQVRAIGSGILRQDPSQTRDNLRSFWYICDLKVAPSHRGQRLPFKMFAKGVPLNYARCPRGYGITMNPPNGKENPVVTLMKKLPILPVSVADELAFFSLDADAARSALPIIRQHRGRVTFRSLKGIKDLVMQSSAQPLPLVHCQFGPFAEHDEEKPIDGCTHMLCVPTGDALCQELGQSGFSSSAGATILHHRMAGWDWSFILTSDI